MLRVLFAAAFLGALAGAAMVTAGAQVWLQRACWQSGGWWHGRPDGSC